MNTGPAPADQQINKFKHDWDQLSDPDRALAITQIKKSGLSNREIARRVQCSENTIRRLLSILHAPAADLAAARQGSISTNELVRRAKDAAIRAEKKKSEARERDRKRKAKEASQTICNWLEQEHLGGSRGEAIALEARSKLIAECAAGKLPYADPQVLHPAAEWIQRCRPSTPVPDDATYIAWYALWLAGWSFCYLRQAELAIDALAVAGKL